MGKSRMHSSKVSLILNISSGHVSPQFHFKMDNNFQTMSMLNNVNSTWMQKCGFEKINKITSDDKMIKQPQEVQNIRTEPNETEINNNENNITTKEHKNEDTQTSLGWRSTRIKNKVDRLS